MSKNLVHVIGKFHEGRTWSLDPFSCRKRIEIQEPVVKNDWQPLVFTLPYKYLRPGATSFCDFRKEPKSMAFQEVFTFFIDMITRMSSSGDDKRDNNCITFVETVLNDIDTPVGVRIFFFSNRSKVQAANIVREMMEAHQKKKIKKFESYEQHKRRETIHAWTKYCATYMGSVDCMSHYTTAVSKFHYEGHECNPTNVFSVESPGFSHSNFRRSQTTGYHDGVFYRFPCENLILSTTPDSISLHKLFENKLYLPSYFFSAVAMPCMKEYHDGEVYRIKVPDHVHRYKKIDDKTLLDIMREKTLQDGVFQFTEEVWKGKEIVVNGEYIGNEEGLKDLCLKFFNVMQMYADEEPVYGTEGIDLFYKSHPLFTTSVISNQWFTDVITDTKNDPQMKTLLCDKHGFDKLDHIKYKTELLSSEHERSELQQMMMKEFVQSIINDEDADVSAPMKKILAWYHNIRDKTRRCARRKVDPKGSVFLNSALWKMTFFDNELHVSTVHPTLMLLQHSKYDAYHQSMDLHVNLIFTGEGATSKSYLFEKMKQMSIPGTVQDLTYQTTRADAIDGDRNDTIIVFHEAPPGMFLRHKSVDPNLEQGMKDKLTSMTVKCKTYVYDDETGTRTNRETVSQAIGVMMGATNDDPSQCSEAMSTRFHFGEFEKTQRKNKSISECMRGESDWAEYGGTLLRKSLEHFHMEHFQVCMVFKMIFCGIIKSPTSAVSDIVYTELSRHLRRDNVDLPTRFKERYDAMCRIFTIVYALDLLYNYEGGKHAGKEFDPMTLLDIEPLLYCTEEIAIFSFTLLSNEVYNPSEYKVKKAIYDMWRATGCKYHKQQEGDTSVDDCNYIRVPKTGKRLRTAIQQRMPIRNGRVSEYNIKAILKKIQETGLEVYPMAERFTVMEKTFNDGLPEPDITKGKQPVDAMLDQQPDTLFHLSLFNAVRRGQYVSPIERAIKKLTHRYTREKTIMLGCPRRILGVIQYASVFEVMHMKPARQTEITMFNPLYKTKEAMAIAERTERLDKEKFQASIIRHDLDRIGCFEHSKRISMNMKEHFTEYSNELLERRVPCIETPMKYPEDIISSMERKNNQEVEYVDEYEGDWDALLLQADAKRMRVE